MAASRSTALSPNLHRASFAKIREPLAVPDLLALQTASFDWLLGNDAWRARVEAAIAEGRKDVPTTSGLEEIFAEISPIEDFSGSMSLSFSDHRFEPPKYTADQCMEKDFTYSAPLFGTAEFMNNETGEIKSQTVFMGEFPLMTHKGTFIINGTERVVVSQLVRSPGVYFERTPDKTSDKDVFVAKIIPSRGAWLEFEVDKKDLVGVRVDRKRKQPVTIFLKALGWTSEEIRERFGAYESIMQTLEKDHVETQDEALLDLYRKLRPGEPPTLENAKALLENFYFNPKRYDLAKVGRYKINKKLGLDEPLSQSVLSKEDIAATIEYLVRLHAGETVAEAPRGEIQIETDDIDHFGNRRLRTVGELIQNQIRTGLSRMERVVRERMTTQDVEAITPQTLINIRPVVASIKEFFGTSQLSQFMDQTNPLAGLTHKRRLSALGPGGLSRERAGFEVRDVHPSHYGRMCPIETPEGPNIGLIGSLATYGRVNAFGFVETPYRKVVGGKVTDQVDYLTADEEDLHVIAQANAAIADDGQFTEDRVLVRRKGGEVDYVPAVEVDYMDVSPRQLWSVATAMIPFLEHDDANRALMGSNMQRQAVPLLRAEAPLVGTGMEFHAAYDAGDMITAEKPGGVTEVSADHIVVSNDDGTTTTYRVQKFHRSNQGTCYNQRPVVNEGDRVVAGQVIADGPSTDLGEMALGKNLLVAFMPWEGHNYEDAIILSQRLVQDDVLSSIHIDEHEIDARDTKLGPEEITRDLPNVSEEVLADLDDRGIIRIGADVVPGDILVGKVTPKGETELTPEERLLRAIFGEKAREVRDTSLKVPHGESGKVIGVRVFDRDEGDELPPGVNRLVRVYVAQKRKITEGDKLAGRHGNKGVIAKILPVEDMPFLPDGTPVDIVLNPLGVPGRMNVGQILETHLGWVAHAGWEADPADPRTAKLSEDVRSVSPGTRVATPVFDGAREDELALIYFAAYMITSVDEEGRHEALPSLEADLGVEKAKIAKRRDADIEARAQKLEADLAELEAEGAKADVRRKVRESAEREMASVRRRADNEIDRLDKVFDRFRTLKVQDLEGDEILYREMRDRYGRWFDGGMGAAAIQKRLQTFDLEAEAESLRETIATGKGQRKARALKRLKVVSAFLNTTNSPLGMVLDAIPVIPPDLRPMVQLDGGRFATSDLNDLYRRVINRNNRLKRLLDLGAPEIIVNNEKRMLQEAVDALFDNGRRGRPVTGPGNRPLKSLSDMLKGKQGRFRQNLLGKRVDYSGRSVIVVGPQLKLHQCGLPKQMALELFKPFVMKRLVDLNHAQNIKSAKRMVERSRPVVWDVLEEVIAEHPVLLNRAPTLHRLGIQAFEPQLIEGKAIQIHPLVCTAFNADFDGDQMAVHLPLSPEAQAEARILMLSSNNILSPANGRPITTPTQDMVLGIYNLTMVGDGPGEEIPAYSSLSEAVMAFDRGILGLQEPVRLRLTDVVPPEGWVAPEGWQPGDPFVLQTTLGRAIFNEALPADFPYVDYQVDKKALGALVNQLADRYPKVDVAATLDALKELGFHWATRAGVTISIDDVVTPPQKAELLAAAEERASKVQAQYERGLITDSERRQELIEIWTRATDEVARAMQDHFPRQNPVFMMVDSGARGNFMQVRQIAGMRGLVANPKGEIIPRPIKSNFREGLSVLEYFISTHGARKGLADTALRTADSGYLTRRLVDVSQDVIIREVDCGTDRGLPVTIAEPGEGGMRLVDNLDTSVASRVLARDVEADGKVVVPAGTVLDMPTLARIAEAGVGDIRVRSVLTCESKVGTCAMCYGDSLATGKLVDVGEAIGIIAAQSIGEPGTQLTMRTFHTGGVAGEDITHGLPRVVELFEARTPKGVAPISEVAGRVRIEETDKARKLVVVPDDGSEEIACTVPRRVRLLVEDGAHVGVGEQLTVGAIDPKQVLRILGQRQVQLHLVDQVQDVYRSQGVSIHDKHIETIVRQMLKRVTIIDSGDSGFLTGELVERGLFEAENRRVVAEGGTPAAGRPELMGITKASLATESWLSAASFQETTRVLTDAAIHAKSDPLLGLKENVILGKLIPAGTGMPVYRNVKVEPTEEAKAAMYATFSGYDDFDYGGFGAISGPAVPLEEFDYGNYR